MPTRICRLVTSLILVGVITATVESQSTGLATANGAQTGLAPVQVAPRVMARYLIHEVRPPFPKWRPQRNSRFSGHNFQDWRRHQDRPHRWTDEPSHRGHGFSKAMEIQAVPGQWCTGVRGNDYNGDDRRRHNDDRKGPNTPACSRSPAGCPIHDGPICQVNGVRGPVTSASPKPCQAPSTVMKTSPQSSRQTR